jgi:hypothetical protein
MTVLDKTRDPNKVSPWGILGSPTPEKIKEWCDMPAGQFTNLVKSAKKKVGRKKNVELKDFTVYVIKTKKIQRVAAVKVTAINESDAYRQAMDIPESELTFGNPYEHKYEDSTHTTWKPNFLNLETVPNKEKTA